MIKQKTYFDGINPKENGIASITLAFHAVFEEPEYCVEEVPWTGMFTKTYWTPTTGFRAVVGDEYGNSMEGTELEEDHLRRLKGKTIKRFKVELFILDGHHRNLSLHADQALTFEQNIKRALLIRNQFTKFSLVK